MASRSDAQHAALWHEAEAELRAHERREAALDRLTAGRSADQLVAEARRIRKSGTGRDDYDAEVTLAVLEAAGAIEAAS